MIITPSARSIRDFLLRPIRDRAHFRERALLLEASILIGIAGGLGAVVFRRAIRFFKTLFFETLLGPLSFDIHGLNPAVISLPLLGGLLVGPLTYYLAREAKGHGVPEIIEAMLFRAGKIRPVVAGVKIVTSAITIGSGGSAGREGPIAQIGGVIGSVTGSKLFKKKQNVRICVMCGVGSGIAGTFNAPLGGAIFALEVVGGGFSSIGSPIPVIIASALGNVVTGVVFGFTPVFGAPDYSFAISEILFFFLMGLIFGALSFLWHSWFYFVEDLFDNSSLHPVIRPALGGLLTGLIGMFFINFDILGTEYTAMELAVSGHFTIPALLLLALAKMLATSLSIGSGGSGGAFAPTLYIGTMFGTAFGLITQNFFPGTIPQPLVFGLVGMGALFAGLMRAPITALILIPEMTNNYHLLIPMAITSALSYAIAGLLKSESFYHTKIIRKGHTIPSHANPLEDIPVSDVMEKHVVVVHPETSVQKLLDMMLKTRHPGYPAVDDENRYKGYVSIFDLKNVHPEKREKTSIKRIIKEDYPTLKPDDHVYHAINMMTYHNIGRLPVVEKRGGKMELVGMISKTDVVRAYKTIVG